MTSRGDGGSISVPDPIESPDGDTGGGDFEGVDWEVIASILAQQAGGSTGRSAGDPLDQPITREGWEDRAIPTLPTEEYDGGRWGGKFALEGPGAEDPSISPRYSTEYPVHTLNDLTSAELAALEVRMQQAGYYDDDDKTVGLGKRSSLLIRNFTDLITEADHNRVKWDDQLNENIRIHELGLDEDDDGYGPFIAPVYLKPDYDTLAQRVKGTMRNGLGRDATSGEMEILTQYLGGAHKDQWQARQYNTQLADHNQRSRAHESGADQGSPTVQDSDMQASFNEMFEGRYENELEHRERVDQTRNQSASLFGSLDTISRSM